MKIQLYFLLLFKLLDWLIKHFQRKKCLAVWFFWAVPGRHKPCRERFIRKKDEFFIIIVLAIQHLLDCWNPSAGKAHALVRTAVSHAQCLVKGEWSFPRISMLKGMDQRCWEKQSCSIKGLLKKHNRNRYLNCVLITTHSYSSTHHTCCFPPCLWKH